MIELKIILDDQGHCKVEGPIDQKMVCYGLLELAKEAIHLHYLSQDKRIQPASALPFSPKIGVN